MSVEMQPSVSRTLLTQPVEEVFVRRVRDDEEFRKTHLAAVVEEVLSGDVEVAALGLRTFINGTIGFEELSNLVDTPTKVLQARFGGNVVPTTDELLEVIEVLRQREGVVFSVAVENDHNEELS